MYRNRNPRAIAFQKAFEGGANEYHNALAHLTGLGFHTSNDLLLFISSIANIHKKQAREVNLVEFLENWFGAAKSPTAGQW